VVANRLGVWSVKAELEDLAFAVLHPEEYEALKAQVGLLCKLICRLTSVPSH
jgi:(p)ppGpp synthase/HD superfamily hydrolase